MSGEADLSRLLATMRPVLHAEPWGFALVGEANILGAEDFALIREAEGLTLIAPAARLAALRLPPGPAMARISLTVHSALTAVGLTAALATALAGEGISANVVAGFHHDHIFLPWDDRLRAMAALHGLAGGAPETGRA